MPLLLAFDLGHSVRVVEDARRRVYLLWHGDDLDEGPDATLLGVYSTEQAAKDRIERASSLPGFRDYPDAFMIVPYEVDKDDWTEGFVEV